MGEIGIFAAPRETAPALRSEDGEANASAVHAEEKLAISKEASPPGDDGGGMRKHSVSPSALYSWRAVAHDGAGSALKRTDSRGHAKPDAEVARMQTELNRLRAVVTEITAENVLLKKN